MVARQIPESETPEGCRFKSDSLHFFVIFPSFHTAISSLARISYSRFFNLSGFPRRLLCFFAASRGL